MPLINSGSSIARSKNIGTEVKAGKPVKQAVAIAYAVGRRAKKTPTLAEVKAERAAK